MSQNCCISLAICNYRPSVGNQGRIGIICEYTFKVQGFALVKREALSVTPGGQSPPLAGCGRSTIGN
jgi:hypothetical protein